MTTDVAEIAAIAGQIRIIQCDPGTVIVDEATGAELIVNDQNAVFYRDAVNVTPKTYAALKAHLEQQP